MNSATRRIALETHQSYLGAIVKGETEGSRISRVVGTVDWTKSEDAAGTADVEAAERRQVLRC
jgi:hypothetical protein